MGKNTLNSVTGRSKHIKHVYVGIGMIHSLGKLLWEGYMAPASLFLLYPTWFDAPISPMSYQANHLFKSLICSCSAVHIVKHFYYYLCALAFSDGYHLKTFLLHEMTHKKTFYP